MRHNILIGIDEAYTNEKILSCFKNRSEYAVTIYDKNDVEQKKRKENLYYDFYWLEYEELDFEKLIERNSRRLCNSYCIRKGLIRKAQLAFYLKKYLTKRPQSNLKKYLPETYIFELDYLDYIEEALNDVFEVETALRDNLTKRANNEKTKKFILKSSMTNKGNDILIFDTRSQLEKFFQNRVDQSEDETLDLREWVIQEYIDAPLQLTAYKNRKFHMRVYVVAVGSLKVYVYQDVLALFCYDSYDSVSKHCEDEVDLKPHITNTCFQLDHLAENVDLDVAEKECVKKFWSLCFDESEPEKNLVKQTHVFDQIKDCVGELFECLLHEPTVFQPVKNAFELYGLDFLVDENLNCFFLEANAFPDFKQTGENLNDLISCLFYQTIAVACDSFFGENPVCDADKMHLVFDREVKVKQ